MEDLNTETDLNTQYIQETILRNTFQASNKNKSHSGTIPNSTWKIIIHYPYKWNCKLLKMNNLTTNIQSDLKIKIRQDIQTQYEILRLPDKYTIQC